jgi:hypothetical protein
MMQRRWKILLTSTSDPFSQNPAIENRRVRLERLLQIASRDFDLRLEFGSRDLVGESQIVMKLGSLDATTIHLGSLKGRALNLLGHKLSEGWTWYEAALRQEAQGSLGFAALWHALEDARVDNWFIGRWPGTAKYFDSNLLPNLGGVLIRRLPAADQLEHGIYLEGRGYHGAHYVYKVRIALQQVADEIARGARGASAQDTYSVMLLIYPLVAHLLRPDMHQISPRHVEEYQEDSAQQDLDKNAGKPPEDNLPEFEESGEFFAVDLLGQRREFPEWFRPGSAPWFERDLGEKEIHPSALRTPRQTIVAPPQGDAEVYKRIRVEVQREAGYLAHRLTNLIREEVYLRYAGYYRTGRLNKAKLWKQRIGNYRLFQRLVTGMSQAVAFALLVDESASMKGGEKYKMAMKAAILLGETLEFMGVPLEIIGYTTQDYEARAAMSLGLVPASDYRTTRCSPLEHRIYKRFDEPFHAARTRLTGIEPRHNNWDEEHLMFAFQRLQARHEQRKVLLVVSDGQPNGDANHLIEMVKRIESRGTKVIGVGIGAEFVYEVYSNAIVVEDFQQLVNELFEVMAREFHARAV